MSRLLIMSAGEAPPRPARRLSWPLLALALVVPVAFAAMLGGYLPMAKSPLMWLGLAGPMTGTTRAWLALFRGEVLAAFLWNPLFWFWGYWLAAAYVELWQRALGDVRAPGVAYASVTWLRCHRLLGPLCLAVILLTLLWQNTPWSWVGASMGR